MSKKKLRDFAPILLALLCAAVFGGLMLAGVIDLETIPQLVADQPALAVLVVAGFYVAKGFSGVVVYNVLVVVVSMIFDLPAALLINSVGTAVTLSISYFLGRSTRTESLEELLDKHPKMKRYFPSTQKYGFLFCFSVHLLGLNMELLGLLFGLLRTGYLTYLAASWLAIAPGMICLTIAGAELNLSSPPVLGDAGHQHGHGNFRNYLYRQKNQKRKEGRAEVCQHKNRCVTASPTAHKMRLFSFGKQGAALHRSYIIHSGIPLTSRRRAC